MLAKAGFLNGVCRHEHNPAFGFGILTGKASVFLELGLIDLDQYNDFGNRGSDLYRSLFEAL